MKNVLWLTAGVVIGFVGAHLINSTPRGRAVFGDLDRKARDFTSAVTDGYREREAELRNALGAAEDTINELSRS